MKRRIDIQNMAGHLFRQSMLFIMGPEMSQILTIYLKSWSKRHLLISGILSLFLVALLSPEISGAISSYYAPGIDSPSYNKNFTLPSSPLRATDSINRTKRVDFVNRRIDPNSRNAATFWVSNKFDESYSFISINSIPNCIICTSQLQQAYQLLDIPPPYSI
jgi:hypothetical protein